MKKLLFVSLITIIICFAIVQSIDESDIFDDIFTSEEIDFIKDNSISYDDILPYMHYQKFNVLHFNDYERIRNNSTNYLEAVNTFHNFDYYTPYINKQKAVFIDTNYVLVNKHYYLDSSYIPKNLTNVSEYNINYIKRDNEVMMACKEALDNYKLMYEAALKENINFIIFSAYRSYEKQEHLYFDVNLENDNFSARPGHSEHQTGLAFDISTSTHGLTENFSLSLEYKWLKDNSYKFGFIERFPKDKVDVTKYEYEPWHFRYVGKEIAAVIYNNSYTLEEYIIKHHEL